jgi:hypothetical protein
LNANLPPPRVTQPYSAYRPTRTDSSDLIAMALEFVFGFFAVPGIGWIYAGNYGIAVGVFVFYWLLVLLEIAVNIVTLGFLGCLALPLNLGLVILSGFRVRDWMRRRNATGSFVRVVVAVLIVLVVFTGLALFLLFGLGLLAWLLAFPTGF